MFLSKKFQSKSFKKTRLPKVYTPLNPQSSIMKFLVGLLVMQQISLNNLFKLMIKNNEWL